MNFLKYCDFFDTKFHFYIGGHPSNSTIFGGIMSITFCVLAILLTFIFSIEDIQKLNPITSKSEVPGGDIRIVNLHNSKIWVPFRMVTYEEKFIDHRGILHPVVSFIEGKWNSSFGMDLTYHKLDYKLCNETSMANKTTEYKIDIPLNEIFCIDNDDIPWGGSWHKDILYYFEVNLFLCEGGIDFNATDPRCTKMSELLKHKNTSWLFEFYYPVVQFEPLNQENPISVIYRSYFYRLSTYANKVERLYIQENIMEDDKSLIGSSKKITSYWGMTNVYGDTYFMPDEKDYLVKSTSSRLYSLVIYMDQGYIRYTRKYKNIFYIISEVLPLLNILLLVFKKSTQYIKLTIAKKNITEYLFTNIHQPQMEKLTPFKNFNDIEKKKSQENLKPKIRVSKNFISKKKQNVENNCSCMVNLNAESIKNSNANSANNSVDKEKEKEKGKEKPKNKHLKLVFNNNNENESNLGDINIIKYLNKNQLKRKTVNEPKRMSFSINDSNRNKSTNKLEQYNTDKKEVFPISYYFMNLILDRFIKPKSFFCLDKKYFIMYNFMVQIFDISSHIRLLKHFIIFKDFYFSSEYNSKRKNLLNLNRKININDEKKMEDIENINDKNGDLFEKSIF